MKIKVNGLLESIAQRFLNLRRFEFLVSLFRGVVPGGAGGAMTHPISTTGDRLCTPN